MNDEFDEGFKIRRCILNMPGEMWVSFNCLSDGEDSIITTPRAFLEKVGLSSGLSAKFNESEKEFFTLLYELKRKEY